MMGSFVSQPWLNWRLFLFVFLLEMTFFFFLFWNWLDLEIQIVFAIVSVILFFFFLDFGVEIKLCARILDTAPTFSLSPTHTAEVDNDPPMDRDWVLIAQVRRRKARDLSMQSLLSWWSTLLRRLADGRIGAIVPMRYYIEPKYCRLLAGRGLPAVVKIDRHSVQTQPAGDHDAP